MNINVARKLHERRYRANPLVTTGEMINLIGGDGLKEALLNRWIVPDMETGFLSLNSNGGKMQELESACVCACGKTECACTPIAESAQVYTMPMRENFAGPGLSSPSQASSTPTGPAPAAPMMPRSQTPTGPASVGPAPKAPRVGDPAVVEQDGKTYQGEVSNVETDGRVRMRWTGDRPSGDRAYGPNEFLISDKQPNA